MSIMIRRLLRRLLEVTFLVVMAPQRGCMVLLAAVVAVVITVVAVAEVDLEGVVLAEAEAGAEARFSLNLF